MLRHVLVMLVVLAAVATSAAAAEFIPSWDMRGTWDSNVLNTDTNEESAPSLRTGPDLRVREQQGDLQYDVRYQLRYEAYAQIQGINSFDQFANAEGSWRATPTTNVGFTDDFGYSSGVNALFDTVGVNNAIQIVTPTLERITTNTANFNVRQNISRLWLMTFAVDNSFVGFSETNQPDSLSTATTLQFTRGITQRLIVGMGGRFQRQDFSDTTDSAGQGSTVYQGYGIVEYRISPTWRLSANMGPALAEPDAITTQSISTSSYYPFAVNTCPTRADGTHFVPQGQALGFNITGPKCQPQFYSNFPGGPPVAEAIPTSATTNVPFVSAGGSLQTVNYFGRISIDKTWNQWDLTLSYDRNASAGSGLGTSTAIDTFYGELRWTPSPYWHLSLNGAYSTQTSLTKQRALQFAVTSQTAAVRVITADGSTSTILAPIAVPFEASQGDPIDNAFTVTTTRVELRGERRLTRQLSLDANASWWQQESTSDFATTTNRSVYRVEFGFTWTFDPIPL